MQDPVFSSEINLIADSVDSGGRFLSQIRLFLAFKKGAGKDTEREEFLLETLAEMHQTLSRQRTPVEVFRIPQIANPASYEIQAF